MSRVAAHVVNMAAAARLAPDSRKPDAYCQPSLAFVDAATNNPKAAASIGHSNRPRSRAARNPTAMKPAR